MSLAFNFKENRDTVARLQQEFEEFAAWRVANQREMAEKYPWFRMSFVERKEPMLPGDLGL